MDSIVLYALALLLLVHRFMCTKRKPAVFLTAALAAGAALALYEGADVLLMLLGILIFNGLVSTYRSRENYAFFLLAMIFVVPFYYLTTLVSQALLLGFLSGAYLFAGQNERASTTVERRRDVIQTILGLALISLFAFFPSAYVKLLLIAAILVASLLGGFSVRNRKSKVSKLLHLLERSGAVLGQGAMWLAAGALVAISFLNGAAMVAVLIAIFIGDAMATLIGTTYRKPLPYNKRKSIAGTLGYFAATAIIAFPFVGYACLLVALVGAVMESLPTHIDDNFDTAVALTVALLFLGSVS